MGIFVSQILADLARQYAEALAKKFAGNLIAVILFGSVARNQAHENSDIDLLLVFQSLPQGRFARKDHVGPYSAIIQKQIDSLHEQGIHTDFNRHVKTADELAIRTPLLYEIVLDGLPLYDPTGFFDKLKTDIQDRMRLLGTQVKWMGKIRYIDFKPDLKPGEIFEL